MLDLGTVGGWEGNVNTNSILRIAQYAAYWLNNQSDILPDVAVNLYLYYIIVIIKQKLIFK